MTKSKPTTSLNPVDGETSLDGQPSSPPRLLRALQVTYRPHDPWKYLPRSAPPVSISHSHLSAARTTGDELPAKALSFTDPQIDRGLVARLSALWSTWRYLRLAAFGVLLILMATGIALAASGILDLGKPTNTLSTNSYFPLGNFHRVKPLQNSSKLAPILFFGGQTQYPSAAEEWPLVKALEQFGTLKSISAASQHCTTVLPDPVHHIPPASGPICSIPTFELSHARMKSPYISLTVRSLVDASGKCSVSSIPVRDWRFFVRYGQVSIAEADKKMFCKALTHEQAFPSFWFQTPLLAIGSYAQAGVQIVSYGDFELALPPVPPGGDPGPLSGLPFTTVRAALATGHNPKGIFSLVQDVNAEANIITAFVCHADGRRPASVCTRPVIGKIMRHIK